jgi:hypothetical protein
MSVFLGFIGGSRRIGPGSTSGCGLGNRLTFGNGVAPLAPGDILGIPGDIPPPNCCNCGNSDDRIAAINGLPAAGLPPDPGLVSNGNGTGDPCMFVLGIRRLSVRIAS